MKLSLQMKGIFIPSWNNNKEQEDNEQIKVEFRYLTLTDRESISDKNATIMSLSKKIWDRNVVSVDGIDLEIDGKSTKFTPDMIYDLPELNDLFLETANYIMTASSLETNEKKN